MFKPLSKIIQLIPGRGRTDLDGGHYEDHILVALCEDGSVWEKRFGTLTGIQWIMTVPTWVARHDLPDLKHNGWNDCNQDLSTAVILTREAAACMVCGDHERQEHLLDQVRILIDGVVTKTHKIKKDPDAFRGSAGS